MRQHERPCCFGYTPGGDFIIVVYEHVNDDAIYPVTAYEVPERENERAWQKKIIRTPNSPPGAGEPCGAEAAARDSGTRSAGSSRRDPPRLQPVARGSRDRAARESRAYLVRGGETGGDSQPQHRPRHRIRPRHQTLQRPGRGRVARTTVGIGRGVSGCPAHAKSSLGPGNTETCDATVM